MLFLREYTIEVGFVLLGWWRPPHSPLSWTYHATTQRSLLATSLVLETHCRLSHARYNLAANILDYSAWLCYQTLLQTLLCTVILNNCSNKQVIHFKQYAYTCMPCTCYIDGYWNQEIEPIYNHLLGRYETSYKRIGLSWRWASNVQETIDLLAYWLHLHRCVICY